MRLALCLCHHLRNVKLRRKRKRYVWTDLYKRGCEVGYSGGGDGILTKQSKGHALKPLLLETSSYGDSDTLVTMMWHCVTMIQTLP